MKPLGIILCVLIILLREGKCKFRIMGGEVADWSKYKFMAYIDLNKAYCSGTLISTRWVLTAGHCIFFKSSPLIYVCLGGHNEVTKGEVCYTSKLQIVPGEYLQYKKLAHDIALVKITGKAGSSKSSGKFEVTLTENITTVDLSDSHITPGQICKTAGWGLILGKLNDTLIYVDSIYFDWDQKFQDPKDQLRDIDLEITDHQNVSKFLKAFWKWNPDLAKHSIWANAWRNMSAIGPMEGDSGGPLMCDGKQAGVSASGTHYKQGSYVIFTRIETHRKWIEQVMKDFHDLDSIDLESEKSMAFLVNCSNFVIYVASVSIFILKIK